MRELDLTTLAECAYPARANGRERRAQEPSPKAAASR